MSNKKVRTSIMINPSVKEAAKDAAKKDDRSLSSYINTILAKALGMNPNA